MTATTRYIFLLLIVIGKPYTTEAQITNCTPVRGPKVWHVAPNGSGYMYKFKKRNTTSNCSLYNATSNSFYVSNNVSDLYPTGSMLYQESTIILISNILALTAKSPCEIPYEIIKIRNGNGTFNNPWSLEFALSNPPDTNDVNGKYDASIQNLSDDLTKKLKWIQPGDIIIIHRNGYNPFSGKYDLKMNYTGFYKNLWNGENYMLGVPSMYVCGFQNDCDNNPIIFLGDGDCDSPNACRDNKPIIDGNKKLAEMRATAENYTPSRTISYNINSTSVTKFYVNPNYLKLYYEDNKCIRIDSACNNCKIFNTIPPNTSKTKGECIQKFFLNTSMKFASLSVLNGSKNIVFQNLEIINSYGQSITTLLPNSVVNEKYTIPLNRRYSYCPGANAFYAENAFASALNVSFWTAACSGSVINYRADSCAERVCKNLLNILSIGDGVNMSHVSNIKLIDLDVHDNGGDGIGNYHSDGTEINGCVLYHNGYHEISTQSKNTDCHPTDETWRKPRNHGYGLYINGDCNENIKNSITNNICYENYRFGFKPAGTDSACVMNLNISKNVLFNNGIAAKTYEDQSNNPNAPLCLLKSNLYIEECRNIVMEGNHMYMKGVVQDKDMKLSLPDNVCLNGSGLTYGQKFRTKNANAYSENFKFYNNHIIGGTSALFLNNLSGVDIQKNILQADFKFCKNPEYISGTALKIQNVCLGKNINSALPWFNVSCTKNSKCIYNNTPDVISSSYVINSNKYLAGNIIKDIGCCDTCSTKQNSAILSITAQNVKNGFCKETYSGNYYIKNTSFFSRNLTNVNLNCPECLTRTSDQLWINSRFTKLESNGDSYKSREEYNSNPTVDIEVHDYNPGAANVTVWNWQKISSIGINLSNTIPANSHFLLYNVQHKKNYRSWVSGIYSTPVTINLSTNFKADSVYGNHSNINNHFIAIDTNGKFFNSFVIYFFPYYPKIVKTKNGYEVEYYDMKKKLITPASSPNYYAYMCSMKLHWAVIVNGYQYKLNNSTGSILQQKIPKGAIISCELIDMNGMKATALYKK